MSIDDCKLKALQVVSALLLCSLVAGEASQCAPSDSPQLRFVAQLSVSGCALLVHDTGASDGPHLAIEPVMCVTDSLRDLALTIDWVLGQAYVSVPVVVRDAGMLAEAQRQLQRLSPRSVSFLEVVSFNVSSEPNPAFEAEAFIWSPTESLGVLRLRSKASENVLSALNFTKTVRAAPAEALSRVTLSALIKLNGFCSMTYRHPMLQNESFFDRTLFRPAYSLPGCRQLRLVRSVNLEKCTARVHQRLDIKGHFLIEPLLCFNINSMSSESVGYDYSRDKHYLKLDLVLQSNASLDAVRTQLADLSPRSVDFMRLWHAESIVSPSLASRYEIGPLMVSADWRSAQLRLFCGSSSRCQRLRSGVQQEPVNLFRHIGWRLTSMVPDLCLASPSATRFMWRMKESGSAAKCHSSASELLSGLRIRSGASAEKFISQQPDGRCFIKIQQRISGSVSFQRSWSEYEAGFGDATDFWIGLSAIHSLSAGGATLRLEMKLWNGTELHAEYAGFQVGDASSKYVMTYRQLLRDRSSFGFDAMERSKGARFSTMDSDNDGRSAHHEHGQSCSNLLGKAGWWFNNCHHVNPNGLFPSSKRTNLSYMSWYSGSQWLSLREVRLLLQV